ncbi:hypothetical protein [Bryobacter aggregatus]|uniref:hypothetical protein n=1 Tax=Bryobacter aggregatus TaxID=360054 RepID=UPI0012BAE3F6|nr:hypothetical protein [Bryobacter aggregatus]
MSKFYGGYGLLLTLFSTYLGFKGYVFNQGDEVRNVPRSVRDNPGSYRSIYSNYHRYTGGK